MAEDANNGDDSMVEYHLNYLTEQLEAQRRKIDEQMNRHIRDIQSLSKQIALQNQDTNVELYSQRARLTQLDDQINEISESIEQQSQNLSLAISQVINTLPDSPHETVKRNKDKSS
ncbi:DUF342 domain-containing protein [Beggiatoa leptomitoformis]|uniref:Uncharacterized protein n=1 Tax=Beggiatoa leptomitoformis TaxID=288004 RepID=A0A2N9YDM4_9GAMM|nr:DUF342 domain-containing protein [Beggiatoa leptomitoformis]ALG69019.2 hypothetical protein AL038_16660 [Beggiatoa leptomitoformis]AUI68581.2 hypothetical protein BLE401_07580 [Beggiatoa leptomitoformis]